MMLYNKKSFKRDNVPHAAISELTATYSISTKPAVGIAVCCCRIEAFRSLHVCFFSCVRHGRSSKRKDRELAMSERHWARNMKLSMQRNSPIRRKSSGRQH
ncbi:hypothetical protein V2G26_006324 [Clonostachys chloroleuca]